MISGVSIVGKSKPQRSAANQKLKTKGSPVDSGLTREISLAKLPSANNAISTPLMSSKVSSPVANALVGSRSDAVSAIGVKSKAGK